MRKCNISPTSCRRRPETPCCKDCREAYCESRCKNDPERCKCWADKPPYKKRERKVGSLQVAWLYGQGMTQLEIARRLGCNRKTVGAILHEMGVGKRGNS